MATALQRGDDRRRRGQRDLVLSRAATEDDTDATRRHEADFSRRDRDGRRLSATPRTQAVLLGVNEADRGERVSVLRRAEFIAATFHVRGRKGGASGCRLALAAFSPLSAPATPLVEAAPQLGLESAVGGPVVLPAA